MTKLGLWSHSFVAGILHSEGRISTKKKEGFLSLESFFPCENPLDSFKGISLQAVFLGVQGTKKQFVL